MEKNLLLTIEYDGTNFHGWQKQPHAVTVQGTLEKALSFICKREMQLNGTSRTDAGVHAYGQRASLKGDIGIPTDRIAFALNNTLKSDKYGENLAGAIRITDVQEMLPDFHARFDAKGKKYIYRIANCREIAVFDRNYYYHVKPELDVQTMRKAAAHIVGTHDFACFQASGGEEKETTVRTVKSLEIAETAMLPENGREIDIEIIGDGFLYNMVRIITGTLVEVGLGKMEPDQVKDIVESCDRTKAGHTAPPQGLYLAEVYYEQTPFAWEEK